MTDRSQRLTGKVALVTGGGSGIGLGVVESFVTEGARVVVADIDTALLKDVADRFSSASILTVETNLLDVGSIQGMIDAAFSAFGRLDIAANVGLAMPASVVGMTSKTTGGGPSFKPFWEQSPIGWSMMMEGTIVTVLNCMAAQARAMITQGQGGAIINVSSTAARAPYEGFAAYCAAKAGIEMLVRCAGLELAPHGIRVNGIAPGIIRTPTAEKNIFSTPLGEAFIHNTPLRRQGRALDIGSAAAFLASDDSAWVTAETLTVDGGLMTRENPRTFELTGAGAP